MAVEMLSLVDPCTQMFSESPGATEAIKRNVRDWFSSERFVFLTRTPKSREVVLGLLESRESARRFHFLIKLALLCLFHQWIN